MPALSVGRILRSYLLALCGPASCRFKSFCWSKAKLSGIVVFPAGLRFRTNRDYEVVCGRAADVLQAMHLFRCGIGDPSGPKIVRVAIRRKLDTTLPNEHELGMEMLVCRMRHLARQQRGFVYFHDLTRRRPNRQGQDGSLRLHSTA